MCFWAMCCPWYICVLSPFQTGDVLDKGKASRVSKDQNFLTPQFKKMASALPSDIASEGFKHLATFLCCSVRLKSLFVSIVNFPYLVTLSGPMVLTKLASALE